MTFFIFWSRQKERKHVLAISFAYFSLGAALLITHIAGEWRDVGSLVLKLCFFSVGAITLVWGICSRIGKKVPIKMMSLIGIVSGIVAVWISTTSDDVNGQIYVLNIAYGSIFAFGTWIIRGQAMKGGVERLLFWALFLTTAQFFVRPAILFGVEGIVYENAYRDSMYWAILHISIAICSLVLALTLIAACASDLMKQMKEISEVDFLTGLKTRRAFNEATSDLFSKVDRSPLPLCFVIVDIDHFKQVNDNYGHQTGDLVIAALGGLIRNSSRKCDVLCRMGGEEFGILLWNADLAGARIYAEALRVSFETLVVPDLPEKLRSTASFGVAILYPGEQFDQLYRRADKALYKAKSEGRNRVVVNMEDSNESNLRSSA